MVLWPADYAYARDAYVLTNGVDSLLDNGKFLSVWKKFPDSQRLMTHDMFSSDQSIPDVKQETEQQQ